jgi:N-acetylglucosaminyldiphosphoundecaprenol N-acetyl-beta-D-mannosaminyltransferase
LAIDDISTEEAIDYCEKHLDLKKSTSIFFLNAHCFNVSLKDDVYLSALMNADLLLNDGAGIKFGAKLIGLRFKENMNGTDFIPHILELAAKKNKKVFLLGSEAGIAMKAKNNIETQIPDIIIVGCESGYFNEEKENEILSKIEPADILIVGMGVPRQEKWIYANRSRLPNVGILIAGGAIIDFCAGKFVRAPKLLRKFQMEWVYRLALEPKRLFKRYAFGNLKFISHVLWSSRKFRIRRWRK